jgi:hypothetical protein
MASAWVGLPISSYHLSTGREWAGGDNCCDVERSQLVEQEIEPARSRGAYSLPAARADPYRRMRLLRRLGLDDDAVEIPPFAG